MTPTTQSILGSDGVPAEFEHKGVTYKLGHPDQRAKARYEEAVVQAKARELGALLKRNLVTPALYAERMEVLGGRLDRGEQAAGGALWAEYTLGDKAATGAALWVWCLLVEHQPAVTVAEAAALLNECGPLLDLAVRRVLPAFFADAGAAIGLTPGQIADLLAAAAEAFARVRPTTPPPTATPGAS